MTRVAAICVLLCGALSPARSAEHPWARAKSIGISSVEFPAQVERGGKLDVNANITGTFENPFDPEQIQVTAHFTTPAGKELRIPAFFYQDFKSNGREEEPSGAPYFKVRYTPLESGTYRLKLSARDRTGQVESPEKSFEVKPAIQEGFIRRAPQNRHYFAHDDGSAYFPIGHNVCWAQNLSEYENYFTQMAAAGENYARLWIGNFTFTALEHAPNYPGDPAGLMSYDLKNAWRLDRILDLAAQKGIHLLLCIESFNDLMIMGEYPNWNKSPYNKELGGPCLKPADFFVEGLPRQIFKNRLDYLVARYGYSRSILAWELFNEVDLVDSYQSDAVRDWHREMAGFLKEHDPNHHLVSTSFSNPVGDSQIDALPELDFTQTHSYSTADAAEIVAQVASSEQKNYGKPHFFGEIGADTSGKLDFKDERGLNLHNGIWASLFAQDAGTAMLWWWDNYIEPRKLYSVFTPLAAYVRGIDFPRTDFVVLAPTVSTKKHTIFEHRITARGVQSVWKDHPSNQPQTIDVGPDGQLGGEENLSQFLHGKVGHLSFHNPVTFRFDSPRDDTFTVHVQGVSDYAYAKLQIIVDGTTALQKDFASHSLKQSGATEVYNGPYSVPIKAGKHEVCVTNEGDDWVQVSSYDICPMPSTNPPIQARALSDQSSKDVLTLLWLKDKSSTFEKIVLQGEKLKTWDDLTVMIPLQRGRYQVAWWDTWSGQTIRTDSLEVGSEGQSFPVPAFTGDIAAKITRLPPGTAPLSSTTPHTTALLLKTP